MLFENWGDIDFEAASHPDCPTLPSGKGNWFIEGYKAAYKKYAMGEKDEQGTAKETGKKTRPRD